MNRSEGTPVDDIEAALASHSFGELFRHLGWDRFQASVSVTCGEEQFALQGLAHKRDFAVFLLSTHRTDLADRGLLREIQRQLRKSHYEHILIHCCDTPRKQVWQWAEDISGDGVEHHEHPFFSDRPPPLLVERIRSMAFALDEEGQITLLDVNERVRQALVPDREFNLFAKRPKLARKSNELAMAVRAGQPGALQAFAHFHVRLARYWSGMPMRWFGLDADDAEQTAMLGLMEAARRFDPERGYQFSTFASHWIRQACSRYGLRVGMFIRAPDYLFWPMLRLERAELTAQASCGGFGVEARFEYELEREGIPLDEWRRFRAARDVQCWSDLHIQQQAALEPRDESSDPEVPILAEDQRLDLMRELEGLERREAQILRLRYGLDGEKQTLWKIGRQLGITRERVRQIENEALDKLRHRLSLRERGGHRSIRNTAQVPKETVQGSSPE